MKDFQLTCGPIYELTNTVTDQIVIPNIITSFLENRSPR